MILYSSELTTVETQYYLQHLIAPRPIALASTTNAQGNVNLSPFSFFNMFSNRPPIVIFSPVRRIRNNTTKHTLENIVEVPEVAIHIVTYDIVHQTSLASCEYPKGTDEFIKAGFTKKQASLIKPPLVAEAAAALECKVTEIKPLGNEGGAGQLVIAEVLCMHINDSLLSADKKVHQQNLGHVARLGGNWYAKISASNLFSVEKPNTQLGIGFDALPEHIRNSEVLTGNHLAQLANVNVLPEKDGSFNEQIENKYNLHSFAKSLIEEGNIHRAWQVLLCSVDPSRSLS
ncbi:MAG: flavin reductase family protein [Chitinophagaceae bacterium]|nr:flavin reductase family protein [Chitinophagaceae bacterium]